MQWAMHWPTDPLSPCSRFAGGGNLFKSIHGFNAQSLSLCIILL